MDIPATDGGEGPTEVLLNVGDDPFVMLFDAGHLAAHADDFVLSWGEVLDAIADALSRRGTRAGVVHDGFVQARPVGLTGVVAVGPDDSPFWGYRPGRTVPSHLIAGTKVATRDLCVWGEWLAPDRFDLWTCYPGGPAPREIHDPEIGLDEVDEAITFWSAHAIVVDRAHADEMRLPG
ncbi:MAG: hypothetical protein U9R47_06945 [Actinomycetota bacterium]|nr:hypothetical protein [Actinomycetota bacterium]